MRHELQDAAPRRSRAPAALTAGGLSLAFLWLGSGKANAFISARRQEGDAAAAIADGNPPFAPNAFIRIEPEGPVRLVMPNVEMGQGIYTGACAMLAEELDVGMDQIVVEHAPPNEALYGIPLLGGQITGGSTSTRSHWGVLREAGAVARSMLVSAAAARWSVDPAELLGEARRRHPRQDRTQAHVRGAREGRGRAADSGQGDAQGARGIHAHREAAAPRRFARQGGGRSPSSEST